MSLSITQIRAAQMIGRGTRDKDVWPALGISESSLYAWKKKADFNSALEIFSRAEIERNAAIAEAAGGTADIEESRRDELFIREKMRPLVEELCGLAADVIANVRDNGVDGIAANKIPSLIGATTDAVKCLRDGNDRLSGLEALLNELGKIEASLSDKVVNIASSGKGSAA